MQTFTSIAVWRSDRDSVPVAPIGFVPTMGALHHGHLSLVEASRKDNALTVVSIFINPEQFEQGSDFETYPVDVRSDSRLLEQAGVDAVLFPDTSQIYADGYRFKVTESEFSQRLCGAQRPGHFEAVLSVVMRLLNLVQPDNAYFGEKDYQQLLLIQDMVAAFFMPVNIVACPTVREPDGLAMSSRNRRLDAQQREQAAALHATLQHSNSATQAHQRLTGLGFEVEYVEDVASRRLAAARLGNTRLIDNVCI